MSVKKTTFAPAGGCPPDGVTEEIPSRNEAARRCPPAAPEEDILRKLAEVRAWIKIAENKRDEKEYWMWIEGQTLLLSKLGEIYERKLKGPPAGNDKVLAQPGENSTTPENHE